MSGTGESAKRLPNILLIFCDQLRADAIGYVGNAIVKTPNIDGLARRGVTYAQCVVTQPTCTPSRASILTGMYPSALRTRMVGCYTPDDPRFLPRLLGRAGYRTDTDLFFWKGHVAMAADRETLIHANAHHMAVACEPIDSALARIAAQEFGALVAHRRLG